MILWSIIIAIAVLGLFELSYNIGLKNAWDFLKAWVSSLGK